MTFKVGVIGCGNVSDVYLQNLQQSEDVEVISVADRSGLGSRAKSETYRIDTACRPDDVIADPEVDIVLNITPPAAHANLTLAAIDAGKHVYSEKPLATTREDGRRILDAAAAGGLTIGCAPDTFLGAGLQTCRKELDDGVIGEPVAASAFMICRGHERWHPNPDFFYKAGGGPLLDMGPYYVTALVSLLGPVKSVSASGRATFSERTIDSQPRQGEKIRVEVPTHVTGALEFANGVIATIMMTFDVWENDLPLMRIYGSKVNMSLPDPNWFEGPVQIQQPYSGWEEVPLVPGRTDNARGLGLVYMARSIEGRGPNLASGDLAFHVLDVLQALEEAAEGKGSIPVDSTCARPELVKGGLQQ